MLLQACPDPGRAVGKRARSLFQGVIEFSLCLLFAKLVSYTFLFWLPLYITNVGEYLLPEAQVSGSVRGCDLRSLPCRFPWSWKEKAHMVRDESTSTMSGNG